MLQLILHFSFLFLLINPSLVEEESRISVKGDSSLHEWELELTDFSFNGEWQEDQLKSLILNATVVSLKSDKSAMDENAHEALNAEEYDKITFKSSSVESLEGQRIKAKGELTISGVSKSATLLGKKNEEEAGFRLVGSYAIDMTDYGIEPPTAMFGVIKVDPKVQVQFNLKFTD